LQKLFEEWEKKKGEAKKSEQNQNQSSGGGMGFGGMAGSLKSATSTFK
jgi:hypothetical protein